LSDAWQQFQVPFAGLTQVGFGTTMTFNAGELQGVQMKFPAGMTYQASFDDVSFY